MKPRDEQGEKEKEEDGDEHGDKEAAKKAGDEQCEKEEDGDDKENAKEAAKKAGATTSRRPVPQRQHSHTFDAGSLFSIQAPSRSMTSEWRTVGDGWRRCPATSSWSRC